LCQELNVSKGSFYYWFNSKADFDIALLQFWRERFTENFIQDAEAGKTSKEKLKRLILNCIENLNNESRLEIELNIWAHQDAKIGSFVNAVYEKRFGYLTKLLKDIYSSETQARRHALILYSLIIGVELFYQKLTQEELKSIFSDYII